MVVRVSWTLILTRAAGRRRRQAGGQRGAAPGGRAGGRGAAPLRMFAHVDAMVAEGDEVSECTV